MEFILRAFYQSPRSGVCSMTRDRQLQLLAGVGILPCVLAFLALEDQRVKYSIVISACVSFFGFLATKAVIPLIKERLLRSNLFGKDINKRGTFCIGLHWPSNARMFQEEYTPNGSSVALQCHNVRHNLQRPTRQTILTQTCDIHNGPQAQKLERRRSPSPWDLLLV